MGARRVVAYPSGTGVWGSLASDNYKLVGETTISCAGNHQLYVRECPAGKVGNYLWKNHSGGAPCNQLLLKTTGMLLVPVIVPGASGRVVVYSQ